jgi:hypothetical protein
MAFQEDAFQASFHRNVTQPKGLERRTESDAKRRRQDEAISYMALKLLHYGRTEDGGGPVRELWLRCVPSTW